MFGSSAWTKTRSLHGCRNFSPLILPLPSLSLSLSLSLFFSLFLTGPTSVALSCVSSRLNFAPKSIFRAKRKKHLLCSHRHTTVIAGPTCLNAHLLVPHDRGESRVASEACGTSAPPRAPNGKKVLTPHASWLGRSSRGLPGRRGQRVESLCPRRSRACFGCQRRLLSARPPTSSRVIGKFLGQPLAAALAPSAQARFQRGKCPPR